MSAVVIQDKDNKVHVLVSTIKNENEMSPMDVTHSKQCINEFRRMMVTLSLYFENNANLSNEIKSMSVSMSKEIDCLKHMTNVVRANVFNSLFDWLNYADLREPNFDMKEIIQPNGVNLTNFIACIYKTPKTNVYSLYQGDVVYKEKFCSIDTCYGTGFEDKFYKYIKTRFTQLKDMERNEISIKCVYVSYYCPISTQFDSVNYEYQLFQYHFCNKTTYYLLLKNNKFECEYILTPEIGRINFI